jgi:hypothetical protein
MPEEETFRVTDRRGVPREAEPPAPPPSAPPPPVPPPSPLPRAESPRVAPPAGEPPEGVRGDEGAAELSGLFIMLASSALINLGEAADPMTGARHVDLDQAEDAIDMLLLLRDKTRGNRTEQESRLLEEILYDLQLRFVRATGGGLPSGS